MGRRCQEIPYRRTAQAPQKHVLIIPIFSDMFERTGFLSALLRVPVFYKIIIANLAIVAVVALVAASLTRQLDQFSTLEHILLYAFFGGITVAVANAFILKFALLPLHELEEAAARVAAGDLTMRAEPSALADRQMEELISTFNAMVDAVQTARDKQRELSIRALHAAEEERKRVALDLHDKTAQTLAGLLLQLSLVKNANSENVRAELLNKASDHAAFAMDEVYRVVRALRPPALELLGLKGAIESHARSLQEENGEITIEVHAADVKGILDAEREIATYRIVQEALSNVVRHSRATLATVRLERTSDGVVISIEDNGIGFAPETLRSPDSLGLFGMQERASYMGGKVEISSGSTGTTVEVQIPINESI